MVHIKCKFTWDAKKEIKYIKTANTDIEKLSKIH